VLVGLTTSTPAGAASSETLNIGFVCSCSGAQASSTAVAKPGYEAWEQYTNAHGGINGHQVKVFYEDDQQNAGTGLAEVETLINQDHVLALVDISGSDTAWQTYAEQHHVPVVGGSTSAQFFSSNPDFFAPGQTLDDYFTNFVDAAKKVGAKSIAELYCAESPDCQEAVAPLKATAAKAHLPLVYVAQISASQPNYTAQCLAAKQAGTQGLIIADSVSVVQSVMKDCVAQGYSPWEISLDGAISGSFTSSPGLSNKLIGSEPDLPFFVTNTPAAKTMVNAFNKYEPGLVHNVNYGEEVTQAWISGMLFEAAAKAGKVGVTGAPTTQELTNGLYALHGETLGGLAPPLTFKKGQPNPVHCWYWVATKNGKFTTPYGLKPDCPPEIPFT
jgi:branched-chain amino acid transport system substrate-binding protein